MKKVLIVGIILCSFAIGYSIGQEDGRGEFANYLLNEGSVLDALDQVECALLSIEHLPDGYQKIHEHLDNAFFWLSIARDMENANI